VPKTAFAGVILDASFARFMASMATFSEERVPPRSFGRWDLISMNRSKGSRGNTMRGGGYQQGAYLNSDAPAMRLTQTQPFGEANYIGG